MRLPEIEAFKGFLICLIVLGHNTAFSASYPGTFNALYNFHVACYLILPCLFFGRGTQAFNLQQRLVRYGIPHLLFFLLTGVLFLLFYRELTLPGLTAWSSDLLLGLVVSSESTVKAATGFGLFWFLPALLALNLIRSAYFIGPRWVSITVLTAGLTAHFFTGLIPSGWNMYIPFSLQLVLFLLPLGLIAGHIWHRWYQHPLAKVLALGLFLLSIYIAEQLGSSVALAGEPRVYSILQPFKLLLHDVYLLSAFFAMIALAGVLPVWVSRGFAFLGKRSLVIFLVHSLVWQALIRLGIENQLEGLNSSPFGAVVAGFSLVMGISVMVAVALDHLPRLSAFIFPRDWAQWRATWQLAKPETNPDL